MRESPVHTYCAGDIAATVALHRSFAPKRRQRVVRTASGQTVYRRTYRKGSPT